jgi:hypothetical protein
MHDENIAVTRGYNMGFGMLSKPILQELINKGPTPKSTEGVFATVMKNCVPKNSSNDDAEARKYAVISLTRMVETYGIDDLGVDII